MITTCEGCSKFFSVCGSPGYLPPPTGGKFCTKCYHEMANKPNPYCEFCEGEGKKFIERLGCDLFCICTFNREEVNFD